MASDIRGTFVGGIISAGNSTISTTGPGEAASTTITDADVNATSNILLSTRSSTDVRDSFGNFELRVTAKAAGSFTVTTRDQVPVDIPFDYVAVSSA